MDAGPRSIEEVTATPTPVAEIGVHASPVKVIGVSSGQVSSSLDLDQRVILLHVERPGGRREALAVPFLDAVDVTQMLYTVIEDLHAGRFTEYMKG